MVGTGADWVGVLIEGRFRVLQLLDGSGGMADVYLCDDRKLERKVVIKTPKQYLLDEDPSIADRFACEIEAMVELAHPHIVTILDKGTFGSRPFIILPYYKGGTLADWRTRNAARLGGPEAVEAVKKWLLPVAEALHHIHRHHYVHRDVKPGNVLFTEHEHVFLGDFGIAKALNNPRSSVRTSSTTQRGNVIGTPAYLAPEYILNRGLDGRTDQYALGIVVYEMLSGGVPFDDPSDTAVMEMHINKVPPRLRDICPHLSPHISDVVQRGLEKDPRRRFENCVAFAHALLERPPEPLPLIPIIDDDGHGEIQSPFIRKDRAPIKTRLRWYCRWNVQFTASMAVAVICDLFFARGWLSVGVLAMFLARAILPHDVLASECEPERPADSGFSIEGVAEPFQENKHDVRPA